MKLRLVMFGSIALFGSTTTMTPDGKVVPPCKIVGKFDVAVVCVNEKGALNTWLDKEGSQKLEGAAADTWASPSKLGDRQESRPDPGVFDFETVTHTTHGDPARCDRYVATQLPDSPRSR